MKNVDCYLCNSSKSSVLFKQKGFDSYLAKVFDKVPEEDLNWVICTGCGFVYRTPALEDMELIALYEKYEQDIFSNTTPDDYFDKIISLPNNESENWKKTEWLKNALTGYKHINERSVFLDIGCGGGTLLYTLREKLSLKNIFGVELNSVYANLASNRLDTDVINENYKSGMFNHLFDLIINTKVLEHVPDPLPFLMEMNRDLNVKGLLFLEVPDISDMYHLPPSHERFFIPHIYFFSVKSLTVLLGRAGFNVVKSRVVQTSRHRSYLQILAMKEDQAADKVEAFDSYLSVKKKIQKNIDKYEL
jgi:SAM-dependent methyltransferase